MKWGNVLGFSGSTAVVPFVATYGVARIIYDSASFNANQNMKRSIDPFWEQRIIKY